MEENTKPTEGETPEKVLTPLDELRQVKDANQKILDGITEQTEKFQALKTDELLKGRAEAGNPEEVKKEETPKEHRSRINKELAEGKFDRKDR